jgi:8-oxo-dGTP pyrophosphatase MutT (NUDIX family)
LILPSKAEQARAGGSDPMMDDLPQPIPAATLILMKQVADGPPLLLMMERTRSMAFAAGALVFPGGRIDPDDEALAARIGGGIEHASARIAAIRETIEETGRAPGLVPIPGAALVSQLRQELEEGTPFSALLEAHGIRLDLEALTPFARWCPNFRETRRFDTLFFVAEAPEGIASEAEAEAVRILWGTAAEVLDDVEAGRAHAIFPTRRNLERLARFAGIEEARADAERHRVRKVVPWIEERGGRQWLCIPDDLGYPVTAEPLETARRS